MRSYLYLGFLIILQILARSTQIPKHIANWITKRLFCSKYFLSPWIKCLRSARRTDWMLSDKLNILQTIKNKLNVLKHHKRYLNKQFPDTQLRTKRWTVDQTEGYLSPRKNIHLRRQSQTAGMRGSDTWSRWLLQWVWTMLWHIECPKLLMQKQFSPQSEWWIVYFGAKGEWVALVLKCGFSLSKITYSHVASSLKFL